MKTTLIPLTVAVRGEIVSSNLQEFQRQVEEFLETLNLNPSSDLEFGEAEGQIKLLKDAESAVKDAKATALSGAASIQELFATVDSVASSIRDSRLKLEKAVTARKAAIREELLTEAMETIQHRKRYQFLPEAETAIKGKKTVLSMKAALAEFVERIQTQISAAQAILDEFASIHGEDLIPDRIDLELRPLELLPDLLESRVTQKRLRAEKAAAEAEAARLRQEAAEAEAAKLAPAIEVPVPAPSAPPSVPKPTPLPIDPAKLAADEWARFRGVVVDAATAIKGAKASLQFPLNRDRAEAFTKAINAAWVQIQTITTP